MEENPLETQLQVQPPTVQNANPPTIIDRLSGFQLYMGNQLARHQGKSTDVADYLPLFGQGINPNDIYNRERVAQKSNEMFNKVQQDAKDIEGFVKENAHLGDHDYQIKQKAFIDEKSKGMPTRQTAKVGSVDPLSLGIALFGAGMNPRFAGKILAAPFDAQLDLQKYQQGVNDREYDDAVAQHKDRLETLGTLAQFAYRDYEKALERATKENDKLAGDQARAISNLLSAKDPGVATAMLGEAKVSGLPPAKYEMYEILAKQREETILAEKKAEEATVQDATDKANLAQHNTLADQFNGEWRNFLTARGEATKEDVNRFNAKRALLKAQGVPPYMLDTPSAGKTAAQKGKEADDGRADAKFKYEKEQDLLQNQQWQQKFASETDHWNAEFALKQSNAAKGGVGQRIAELTKEFEDALTAVKAKLLTPYTAVSADADKRAEEFAKWTNETASLAAKAYSALNAKRRKAGGRELSYTEFIHQHLKEALPMFGQGPKELRGNVDSGNRSVKPPKSGTPPKTGSGGQATYEMVNGKRVWRLPK